MQSDDFIDFLSYILIPSGWLLATTSILMEFEWARQKLGLSKKFLTISAVTLPFLLAASGATIILVGMIYPAKSYLF